MKQQDKYWDKVAPTKEFATPFNMELFKKHVKEDSKILDYGCGYGRTIKYLINNGYTNLTGIDFSEKMIERAKKEESMIEFKVVKNNILPFKDNSFDAVLLLAVLTCVIYDDDQDKIIKEIKRVLKPEGVIYINDFLVNTDQRNMMRYEKFKEKYNCYGVFELEEGAILRHFDENRICELTNRFDEIEYKKVVYTTMNGNKSNGFNYIGMVKI